ncbi:MAG: protein translocase subunit SecF [Pseudomonadota bacterium]
MFEGKTIPFMRYRNPAAIFSGVLLLVCFVSFFVNGLKYGLDFTGGTQMAVHYEAPPVLEEVRQSLVDAGFVNNEVVFYGTDQDVLIRVQAEAGTETSEETSSETAVKVMQVLQATHGDDVNLESSSFVSSQVGDEMKEQGILGMLVSLIMVMIYIAMRFQFKFSVGAVASLAHDSIITMGFFSITQMDFDLTVMAAVLAMIGYSLNDTIVVADRIRENFRLLRGSEPEEIIDISVTQTLIRTLITSFTTLLVLLALFFFGGQAVYGFSVALIVGVVIGTYSSIYVAATTLVYMNISKQDMMPPVKRQEELDAVP